MSRLGLSLEDFLVLLERVRARLQEVATHSPFADASAFELAVVNALRLDGAVTDERIEHEPGSQGFPDIVVDGTFGVEVKFKLGTDRAPMQWREVANSIFEGSRHPTVDEVYVLFGRMLPVPEVRVRRYEEAICHVRTSHVPRFVISMDDSDSLFHGADGIELSYSEFRGLSDKEKMQHVRDYARRKHPNDWLWWIEDPQESEGAELVLRNFTSLPLLEKQQLAAEAIVLCPQCLGGGKGGQNKLKTLFYAKIGGYWIRAHSVYSGNVRDALTAGSMVGDCPDRLRMRCLVSNIAFLVPPAVASLSDELMREFWGELVPSGERFRYWLALADEHAEYWTPSMEIAWEI